MSRSAYPEFLPAALPRWALVRQRLDTAAIDDVPAAVRLAMDDVIGTVRPGHARASPSAAAASTASTRS